jgi:transmembrane sensor
MKRSNPFEISKGPGLEEQAALDFIRQRLGRAANEDGQSDTRRVSDPAFADAYRRVEQSWASVAEHATAPEIMALREGAIARARRANARRWRLPRHGNAGRWWAAASIAAVALFLFIVLQRIFPPPGTGSFQTAYGEQRVVELPDHSRIALDARTRLKVRFSGDVRSVQLLEGQAQFSVAKDPLRPFKVDAGGRTIVAVGTVFNVEFVDREVNVAMMEGRVAVLQESDTAAMPTLSLPANSNDKKSSAVIELSAGEELRVSADGKSALVPKADIEAATAWRQGKVIFRNDPLAQAVRRLNRYSRRQLKVDDAALAKMTISGVFDAGDVQAFADALSSYLPIVADSSNESTIHLKAKY